MLYKFLRINCRICRYYIKTRCGRICWYRYVYAFLFTVAGKTVNSVEGYLIAKNKWEEKTWKQRQTKTLFVR